MRSSIGFAIVSAVLILSPFAASAATIDDVQAEIQRILDQLQSLRSQTPDVSATVTAGENSQQSGASSKRTCVVIERTLRLGSAGEDVSALQQFLSAMPDIYPERQVTGYFGALTQKAVQRFQAAQGIVGSGTPDSTGYGLVGSRTRAALANCPQGGGDGSDAGGPDDSEVGALMKVAPIKGPSPLEVSIDVFGNTARSCSATTYSIDFGDNSRWENLTVPAGTCSEVEQSYKHVYAIPGTYTVFLFSGTHRASASIIVTN